jgi:hypothetical protein
MAFVSSFGCILTAASMPRLFFSLSLYSVRWHHTTRHTITSSVHGAAATAREAPSTRRIRQRPVRQGALRARPSTRAHYCTRPGRGVPALEERALVALLAVSRGHTAVGEVTHAFHELIHRAAPASLRGQRPQTHRRFARRPQRLAGGQNGENASKFPPATGFQNPFLWYKSAKRGGKSEFLQETS